MASSMTVGDLLQFREASWMEASDAWSRLAAGIYAATDQLIRGTRDLTEVWQFGIGSGKAHETATKLRIEMDNTHEPALLMAGAFSRYAYAMRGLREQAVTIIEVARKAGHSVDLVAETITSTRPPLLPSTDSSGQPGILRMREESQNDEAAQLAVDLRLVKEAAQKLDDETAATITKYLPSVSVGFGSLPPDVIPRMQGFVEKFKVEGYEPSRAELHDLRTLIEHHGKDPVFAHRFLDTLGGKELVWLNRTLATYQTDWPGDKPGGTKGETAELLGDLQRGLGVMLSTATQPTGFMTGPPEPSYVPGEFELSPEWIDGLMATGRSLIEFHSPGSIGSPIPPTVYGYQLLSPLLRAGDFDSGFLSTIGGDIIDFEIEQDRGGGLWGPSGHENIRLDWTQQSDDRLAPAGFDPVHALMDALQHDGEATRDLLTHTSDGSEDGRLERLDYLLTDREWSPNPDIPGGDYWRSQIDWPGDNRSEALDKFGIALERATTEERGPEALRLVEEIINETNADEQMKGYVNQEKSGWGVKTDDFAAADYIQPQLREPMANILSAYIHDVNANLHEVGGGITDDMIKVDSSYLTRFIADIGKDENANQTLASAEAVYAAAKYDEFLSAEQGPNDTMQENLNEMWTVSRTYGTVLGALDFAVAEMRHETSEEQDARHNQRIDNGFMVAGALVEGVVGAGASRIPGAVGVVAGGLGESAVGGGSDAVNSLVLAAMAKAAEPLKVDNSGQAIYDVAGTVSAGRSMAAHLVEAALYRSGTLPKMPDELFQDGKLIPATELDEPTLAIWERYKADEGLSTVVFAAGQAGDSYTKGFNYAKTLVTR